MLVVATNSMKGYVSDAYLTEIVSAYSDTYNAETEVAEKKLKDSRFEVGDLLTFIVVSPDEQLVEYLVQ